jgi:ABC-2 type transport system ATP-binding protein
VSGIQPTRADRPAVEVESVGVGVGGELLLHPVSFTLDAGQGLAITGTNGSGKTTLLRVLAGLVEPNSGSARVGGLNVNERNARFRRTVAGLIGYPPIARDLTLEEQLTLVAVSWGASMPTARVRAATLLAEFDISRLRQRFAHELSSGQSQLFSLALTLARPFDVLLLDEPEQRLDVDRLELVSGLLRKLVDDGKTLVFASHNRFMIEALSDRVISLDRAA